MPLRYFIAYTYSRPDGIFGFANIVIEVPTYIKGIEEIQRIEEEIRKQVDFLDDHDEVAVVNFKQMWGKQ